MNAGNSDSNDQFMLVFGGRCFLDGDNHGDKGKETPLERSNLTGSTL